MFIWSILKQKGDKAEHFLIRLTLRTVTDDFYPHHCFLIFTLVQKLKGQVITLNELLHQSRRFKTYREAFLSLDVAKMTFKSQIFPLVAANMGDLRN